VTTAPALRAVAVPITGAAGGDTLTVWSVKTSRSTLRTVSVPSTAVPPT
jgi:hypothetical protein